MIQNQGFMALIFLKNRRNMVSFGDIALVLWMGKDAFHEW